MFVGASHLFCLLISQYLEALSLLIKLFIFAHCVSEIACHLCWPQTWPTWSMMVVSRETASSSSSTCAARPSTSCADTQTSSGTSSCWSVPHACFINGPLHSRSSLHPPPSFHRLQWPVVCTVGWSPSPLSPHHPVTVACCLHSRTSPPHPSYSGLLSP